jgi:hypothetical protein
MDPLTASFAVASLAGGREVLLLARAGGPIFRAKELDELERIVKIAVRIAARPTDVLTTP